MTRLLLDEMLPATIAEQLRAQGHDAVAIVERPELRGAGDVDVLEVAAAESRVLVTLNIANFVALDRSWSSLGRTHAGIAVVSTTTFPLRRDFARRVTAALTAALDAGTLPARGSLRFLPFAARAR